MLQETELQYLKFSYESNYNALHLQWKKADEINMLKKMENISKIKWIGINCIFFFFLKFYKREKYTTVGSSFNVKHCQKITMLGAKINGIVEFLQIIVEFICSCMEIISPELLN